MKTTLALLSAAAATALLGGCAVYPAPYAYGGADVYYQSSPAPVYGAPPVYVAPPPVYWRSAPPAYRYDGRGGPGWGRRDADRDGVPNRFDRDRDGDGVPNRRDARPNDPRRY